MQFIKILVMILSLSFNTFLSNNSFIQNKHLIKGENILKLNIKSKSFAVYNPKNGIFLFKKNFNQKLPIASLTKLASILTFLKFNKDLKGEIVIKKQDIVNGNRQNVFIKDKILIKDLFYIALIASDNTAIKALVRSTNISEDDFVKEMNKLVKILGLKNTVFYDITGLSPKNISTSYDIAILSNFAFKNKYIADATSKIIYKFKPLNASNYRKVYSTSINFLPNYNINRKTGYTSEAKGCFVIKINDYIFVILGSNDRKSRFSDMKQLLKLFSFFM